MWVISFRRDDVTRFYASIILAGLLSLTAVASEEAGRYLERDEFLSMAFPLAKPEPGTLWVTPELRKAVEQVLGHRFAMLRVRYWHDGATTAWILDEIGKEEPITVGISVDDRRVEMVRILEFRESRGWEVRYPFFTDQFNGAKLADQNSIDRRIDGISGATLSVDAVSRVVRVALVLHEESGVGASGDIGSTPAS